MQLWLLTDFQVESTHTHKPGLQWKLLLLPSDSPHCFYSPVTAWVNSMLPSIPETCIDMMVPFLMENIAVQMGKTWLLPVVFKLSTSKCINTFLWNSQCAYCKSKICDACGLFNNLDQRKRDLPIEHQSNTELLVVSGSSLCSRKGNTGMFRAPK